MRLSVVMSVAHGVSALKDCTLCAIGIIIIIIVLCSYVYFCDRTTWGSL